MSYKNHIETLQQRFSKALKSTKYQSAVIYSGHQNTPFMDDNALPFKINPYFKYWLPLTLQQRSFIHIHSERKPTLYLFLDDDYWHAQPVVPEGEWQNYFDIIVIKSQDEVKKALDLQLHQAALICGETENFKDWGFKAANPEPLMAKLNFQRAYKTEYEIGNMRIANQLAAKAHLAAKQAFEQGKSELETHLAYLEALNVRESALPYNNIIAFNDAGSILHYDQYKTKPPQQRLSFLIDAGADYQGYNADISRTYLNEELVDSEYIELFAAYKKEYYGLLDEIKLGGDYLKFHDSSHRRISKLLSKFELVKGTPEQVYAGGYSRLFFPCGTGHYIGLQVHDIGGYLADDSGKLLDKDPRYPYLRMRRPMEKNTVFTVEPGIYFIRQLLNTVHADPKMNWNKINHFSQYGGFRLEDSIAITKNGAENLSQRAFDQL